MAHNKTRLAQAAPAGTAYYVVRPKAGHYGARKVLFSTLSVRSTLKYNKKPPHE